MSNVKSRCHVNANNPPAKGGIMAEHVQASGSKEFNYRASLLFFPILFWQTKKLRWQSVVLYNCKPAIEFWNLKKKKTCSLFRRVGVSGYSWWFVLVHVWFCFLSCLLVHVWFCFLGCFAGSCLILFLGCLTFFGVRQCSVYIVRPLFGALGIFLLCSFWIIWQVHAKLSGGRVSLFTVSSGNSQITKREMSRISSKPINLFLHEN